MARSMQDQDPARTRDGHRQMGGQREKARALHHLKGHRQEDLVDRMDPVDPVDLVDPVDPVDLVDLVDLGGPEDLVGRDCLA
jgi:Mg/Co/Ni transporter MgtE